MIKSAAYQSFHFFRDAVLEDLNTYLERTDLPVNVEVAAGQARNDIIRALAKVEAALDETGYETTEQIMARIALGSVA